MSITLYQIARLLDPTRFDTLLKAEAAATAVEAEGLTKANLSGPVLSIRSGLLRRSVEATSYPEGPDYVVRLRAGGGAKDVKYAAIHENGGVIRPKKGRLLWIPTALSRTPSGVNRYSGPSTDPRPMAYVQSRRGQPLLVSAKRTKSGKAAKGYGLDVYYIGRQKVVIPKRPYALPAMEDAQRRSQVRLQARLVKLLDGSNV